MPGGNRRPLVTAQKRSDAMKKGWRFFLLISGLWLPCLGGLLFADSGAGALPPPVDSFTTTPPTPSSSPQNNKYRDYINKVAKSAHVEAMQDLKNVREACRGTEVSNKDENKEGTTFNVNYAIETYLSAASDPTGMGGGTPKSLEYKTRAWNFSQIKALTPEAPEGRKCKAALLAQAVRDQYQYSKEREEQACRGDTNGEECRQWKNNTAYIEKQYGQLLEDLKSGDLIASIYGCASPPCAAVQNTLDQLRNVWKGATANPLGALIDKTKGAQDMAQLLATPLTSTDPSPPTQGSTATLGNLVNSPLELDCGGTETAQIPPGGSLFTKGNKEQCTQKLQNDLAEKTKNAQQACLADNQCDFTPLIEALDNKLVRDRQTLSALQDGVAKIEEQKQTNICFVNPATTKCRGLEQLNNKLKEKQKALIDERHILTEKKNEVETLARQHNEYQIALSEMASVVAVNKEQLTDTAIIKKTLLRTDGQFDNQKLENLKKKNEELKQKDLGPFQDKLARNLPKVAALEKEREKYLKPIDNSLTEGLPIKLPATREEVQISSKEAFINYFRDKNHAAGYSSGITNHKQYQQGRLPYVKLRDNYVKKCARGGCSPQERCLSYLSDMALQGYDHVNCKNKLLGCNVAGDYMSYCSAARAYQTANCGNWQ